MANFFKNFYLFIYNIVKSYFDNHCYEKSAALSFYTLLSIVPFLAVLFGIAHGFGFDKNFERVIHERLFQQPEVADKLIEFAKSNLENIKRSVITGIGTILLLWTVIGLLNSIETTLNQIWKVRNDRSYFAKIKDYLTFLFIAPIIFVISSTLNIYLTAEITKNVDNIFISALSPILLLLLNLFPLFLIWILFIFIYHLIPNTKVNYYEAIVAGVIAGTAFQIWQWVYIQLQFTLSSYSTIYGSFAALPLFMIWLQVSWLIVLVGAVIAVEVRKGFFQSDQKTHLLSTKALAFLIVDSSIEAFVKGNLPLTENQFVKKFGCSLHDLHLVIEPLVKNHILSEVYSEGEHGFQPARAINDITIMMIVNAMEKSYEIPSVIEDLQDLEKMEKILRECNEAIALKIGNRPLHSFVVDRRFS